jgi:hypothetical protein
MEASVILWIIIILAAGVVMTIVLTNSRKEDRKPVLKKSPARYVTVSSNEDIQTFMDVYSLEWKPDRDKEPEIPPQVEEIIDKIDNISRLSRNSHPS